VNKPNPFSGNPSTVPPFACLFSSGCILVAASVV
jgi:hypothetical protein